MGHNSTQSGSGSQYHGSKYTRRGKAGFGSENKTVSLSPE